MYLNNIDNILNRNLELLQTIYFNAKVDYINNALIIDDTNIARLKCNLLRFFYDRDVINLQLTDCREMIYYILNRAYIDNNKIIIPIA